MRPVGRRLNVHVDLETHRALRLEAARQDVTIQALVERWAREKLGLSSSTEPEYRPNLRSASLTCDRPG